MKLTPRDALFAAVEGLEVFAWYALPDAVRSRRARTAIKTVLLSMRVATLALWFANDTGGRGVGCLCEADGHGESSGPVGCTCGPDGYGDGCTCGPDGCGDDCACHAEKDHHATCCDADHAPTMKPALIAGAVAVGAAGIAGSIWAEKAIFARGERRRAHGKRFAHLPAALALGVGSAVLSLIPLDDNAR